MKYDALRCDVEGGMKGFADGIELLRLKKKPDAMRFGEK